MLEIFLKLVSANIVQLIIHAQVSYFYVLYCLLAFKTNF